jgi:Cu(I)/Ag(I) efflux system membrane fusion protein
MKKINLIALLVAVISSVAAGSYWLGSHQTDHSKPQTENRKLLYYRNPMGLPDTSPVPKKDAMGMDYVAVYAGEANEDGAVNISADKVQKLGVKSEAAQLRSLSNTLHVAGRIEIDERKTYAIAPKFEGWVERLYVNSTGQPVAKGQPLFDVYSPELVSARREYALAAQGEANLANADEEARNGMKRLAEAALARLKNWDMAAGDKRNLTFASPVSGIVLEKKAVQGMRFMPGEALYQIADLSTVWVIAEVAEQDMAQLALGGHAQVGIDAYPDTPFEGKIAFIYPTLNPATRTVQVRVEVDNPQGKLKPAMFARVTLPAGKQSRVLSVPASAVIDSGTRQIVLVQRAPGSYSPRSVRLGLRGGDYVEVREGLREGEQVVTSALFLIDAESNLKAALQGLGGAEPPALVEPAPAVQPAVIQPVPKRKPVGNQAVGILNGINQDGSVNITHEAIAALNWPGMTMDFALANSSLAAGIRPGSAITFELVERKPDEWLITRMQPKPANLHEGH